MSGSTGGYGSYGGTGGGYGASTGGMAPQYGYGGNMGYGGGMNQGAWPGQYGGGYGGMGGQYNPMSRANAYGGFNPYGAQQAQPMQAQTDQMGTGRPDFSQSPGNAAIQTDQPPPQPLPPWAYSPANQAGGGYQPPAPVQSFSPANPIHTVSGGMARDTRGGVMMPSIRPLPPQPIQATPAPPQQPPAPLDWRNMTPGQRADAAYQKSLGGQQPLGGLPAQTTPSITPTTAGTPPQPPNYGYGTPGGYQFDTAQSTLDPNSMNFLLNWMGGTVNGQNPQQQSQQYLETYRQRYPNGVPGINNPTTPNTNYLTGVRF